MRLTNSRVTSADPATDLSRAAGQAQKVALKITAR
jgi:hypothetical protein